MNEPVLVFLYKSPRKSLYQRAHLIFSTTKLMVKIKTELHLTLWGLWTRLSVQKILLFFPKKKKKLARPDSRPT